MTKPLHPGKRICVLALTMCLLIALVSPVAAAEATQNTPNQKAFTLTTVVRNYGFSSAVVIGQIENGTKITVLDQQNDFYKVDCYDMTGYIAVSQVEKKENGDYFVNCVEGSAETRVMYYETHADAFSLRQSILALGDAQLGTPYVYGSARPGGFDCSGFTYYLYQSHGFPITRRASTQLQDGIVVPKEGMMVGDLVFFREATETSEASHVGIYAGNNTIIHARSNGICYDDLDESWYVENFLCARRVINTSAAQIAELPAPSANDTCVVRSVSGRTAH